MNEWMTIKDLCDYLQITEGKADALIQDGGIPYHNEHGFLRFHKEEIDEWMKTPSHTKKEVSEMNNFTYRGQPILDYMLTASKILIGDKAWGKLKGFIASTVMAINASPRDYLYRDEFEPFIKNYMDYLRICCQLGIIDSIKEDERKKHYYITDYAKRISEANTPSEIKSIILESVENIVMGERERFPDERHAVYLLWYYLTLKHSDILPSEEYFTKSEREKSNFYPKIRLSFAESICEYLFDNNEEQENQFLARINELSA